MRRVLVDAGGAVAIVRRRGEAVAQAVVVLPLQPPRTRRVGKTSGKTRRLPTGSARHHNGSRACPFRAGFAPRFPLVLPPSCLPPPGSRPRWAGWAGPGEPCTSGLAPDRGGRPGTPLSPPPRARIPSAPLGRTLERNKAGRPRPSDPELVKSLAESGGDGLAGVGGREPRTR